MLSGHSSPERDAIFVLLWASEKNHVLVRSSVERPFATAASEPRFAQSDPGELMMMVATTSAVCEGLNGNRDSATAPAARRISRTRIRQR